MDQRPINDDGRGQRRARSFEMTTATRDQSHEETCTKDGIGSCEESIGMLPQLTIPGMRVPGV